ARHRLECRVAARGMRPPRDLRRRRQRGSVGGGDDAGSRDRPRHARHRRGARARTLFQLAPHGGRDDSCLSGSNGGRMKVGLHADAVAHAIPGGIGSYVRCLADEMLRSSPEVDLRLLVSRSADALPQNWPPTAIQRSPLPLHALYGAWNFLRKPVLTGLDVVHAPGLVMPPVRGGRLVATVHDDNVEQFPQLVPPVWRALYRRGFRLALREAAVLCAPCEATKRRL